MTKVLVSAAVLAGLGVLGRLLDADPASVGAPTGGASTTG